MRYICFLLSIYILFLVTLPCVDSREQCKKDSCAVSHTHNYAHGHGEENEDGCSPFCVCNCCSTSVIVSITQSFSAPEDVVVNSVQSFYKEISSEFFCTIWQPPKI